MVKAKLRQCTVTRELRKGIRQLQWEGWPEGAGRQHLNQHRHQGRQQLSLIKRCHNRDETIINASWSWELYLHAHLIFFQTVSESTLVALCLYLNMPEDEWFKP